MRTALLLAAALLAAPALAQSEKPADQPVAPSPGEIVAAAPAGEWVAIAPEDLLVMDLTPGAWDQPRRVVIQLIPAPFSEPWVANIRTLAKAHWWDGLAIVRAQDNYVVQWGDPDGEDAAKAKPLPSALTPTTETGYLSEPLGIMCAGSDRLYTPCSIDEAGVYETVEGERPRVIGATDPYAARTAFYRGWPIGAASAAFESIWPVHCYGNVGVGRGMSPDAGSGAELYTVIGHAPRHLDRNIAVVGRVIEGIEHLSTLPRGTEALGFYKTPQERTPIAAIRLGSEVPGLPAYQYLSTESPTFARYAEARANRRDPFFIVPAGGADVCNIPVPVRRTPAPAK